MDVEERRVAKVATKDWVQKSFTKEGGRVDLKHVGGTITVGLSEQTDGLGIHNTTWYRNMEEEVAVAKMVYAQNEAWEKVEGTFRRSKMVEKEPEQGLEDLPVTHVAAFGGGCGSGSTLPSKEKQKGRRNPAEFDRRRGDYYENQRRRRP